MADMFTKKRRSEIMASISSRETEPEIIVRKFLFKQGFRYRKNVKTIFGTLDIVLSRYETIIFIHGCFWHGHNCKRANKPKSNTDYWLPKIEGNIERDKRVKRELKKLGWQVLTIWVCDLNSKDRFNTTMNRLVKKLRANDNLDK